MVKEKEEVKEKSKEKWILENVPTQTTPMIVDTETKEVYSLELALVKVLNKLERLEGLL